MEIHEPHWHLSSVPNAINLEENIDDARRLRSETGLHFVVLESPDVIGVNLKTGESGQLLFVTDSCTHKRAYSDYTCRWKTLFDSFPIKMKVKSDGPKSGTMGCTGLHLT